MVFGALSAMLYGGHPALSIGTVLRKVDVRTVFFGTICITVLLVLAYLTNPSETSFRAYLTEQSFRQHLSRLDEAAQDDEADARNAGVHFTLSKQSATIAHKSGASFGIQSPFHFVNRASISLRTPKHIIRSFGILTIAAVLPSGSSQTRSAIAVESSPSTVNDSWFIGAFGKWWRGGSIRAWWHNSFVASKDAERLTSGILDVKALDSLECYEGLPFNSTSTSLHLPSTDSTTKLRGTERSTQRTVTNSTRSTTPPPLPKSASLPLHAPRLPATPPKSDRNNSQRHNHSPVQVQGCNVTDQLRLNTPPNHSYSSSSTSLFDSSPVIAEILRQITHSKSAVHDLRTQLTDFHAAAAQSHAVIQADLDAQRARKRADDVARLELKTHTRALEDAKRVAEGTKRDAEKRLRAAEGARDNASRRVERLDQEIDALKERIREDEEVVIRVKEEGDRTEGEAKEEMDAKKKEIKVAEEVVAALSARAKELEEKILKEEERLKAAKEHAELRKQDRSFYPLHVVTTSGEDEANPWSPMPVYSQAGTQDLPAQTNTDFGSSVEIFPKPLQVSPGRGIDSMATQKPRGLSISPRPKTLSLGGISNFREQLRPMVPESNNDAFLRPQAYSFHDEKRSAPLSSAPTHSLRFFPFGDSDSDPLSGSLQGGEAISPRSTSLIPSSLINSLESSSSMEDLSRSFQSDNDDVMDPNWRSMRPLPPPVEVPSAFTSSPTSITNPSFDGVDREDPFEIRPPPLALRRRLTAENMEVPHALAPSPARTISDPQSIPQLKSEVGDADDRIGAAHRRWHSADPKEKKGLNPEAKVFRLNKKSLPSFFPPQQATSTFDPMGPNSSAMPSTLSVPCMLPPLTSDSESLFSSISMRAFAPSREEREVLQRALGGSSNTSLERLPTLSELSLASMPPSPSHVHANATQRTPPGSEVGVRTLNPSVFSWMRKPTFSPWEDEVVESKKGRDDQ